MHTDIKKKNQAYRLFNPFPVLTSIEIQVSLRFCNVLFLIIEGVNINRLKFERNRNRVTFFNVLFLIIEKVNMNRLESTETG